jgi:NAD(P)-dependent dehydrogenase (short-subunit alcohol dehydrogenase family)
MSTFLHPLRASAPVNLLLAGASGGIGTALADLLLQRQPSLRLIALARRATASTALAELEQRHPGRLQRIDVDLADAAAIEALPQRLPDEVGLLHGVINASGLLHDQTLQPEKSLQQLDGDALQRSFAVNAFAPILLLRALLPRLRHQEPCVIASLSARVGSIGDNRLGGWYAYRAAKAAQNQLLRTFAIELRRINPRATCVLLHPGTVATPLSAPFRARVDAATLQTPLQSATHLLDVLQGCGPENSGEFFAWDGSAIPW